MSQQETIEVKPNGKVYLNLPDKSYKPYRCIGFIKARTFNTVRKSSNQKFRNTNSIGLNYKLLSHGEAYFDYIRIEYDFEILETHRDYFMEYGEFRHFKKNNLDQQLFLSLDKFGMDKVNEWAAEKERRKKTKDKILKKAVIQISMF